MKSLGDGGMRHISWLGLRSVRFYPPTPARTRTVMVPTGIMSLHFPRMVFLVVRVGLSRRLHAFEVDDCVKRIGPATVLRPMIGNSLSIDGWVCMGSGFRAFFGLHRDLVMRYWNTSFTSSPAPVYGNATVVWRYEEAGRIDYGETIKQLMFLFFGVVFYASLFFFVKSVLS